MLQNVSLTFGSGPISEEDLDQQLEGYEEDVSYLVRQHKLEILDGRLSYQAVMRETINDAFTEMLQMSLFVPLLHPESPRPQAQQSK